MAEEKIDDNIETSHSTARAFVVEARVRPSLLVMPVVTASLILDERWRRVPFDKSPIGVPSQLWCAELRSRGYLSYEAAMALAYWFLCAVDALSVEVRLVEYEGITDVKIRRVEEHAAIGNYGMRLQERVLQAQDSARQPLMNDQSRK